MSLKQTWDLFTEWLNELFLVRGGHRKLAFGVPWVEYSYHHGLSVNQAPSRWPEKWCGSHFHVAYRSVCDWDQEISILSEAWPRFWRSRTLFTDQEAWPRSQTLLWAVGKWLPLVVLTTENNYLDPLLPTHIWLLTVYLWHACTVNHQLHAYQEANRSWSCWFIAWM